MPHSQINELIFLPQLAFWQTFMRRRFMWFSYHFAVYIRAVNRAGICKGISGSRAMGEQAELLWARTSCNVQPLWVDSRRCCPHTPWWIGGWRTQWCCGLCKTRWCSGWFCFQDAKDFHPATVQLQNGTRRHAHQLLQLLTKRYGTSSQLHISCWEVLFLYQYGIVEWDYLIVVACWLCIMIPHAPGTWQGNLEKVASATGGSKVAALKAGWTVRWQSMGSALMQQCLCTGRILGMIRV